MDFKLLLSYFFLDKNNLITRIKFMLYCIESLKSRTKEWILFCPIFVLIAFLNSTVYANMPHNFPFHSGERLEYDLEWGVFNVGRAILEVKDTQEWNGIPCWHLVFSIETNRFADKIYKIRTISESYVSKDFKRTLFYTKNQHEGNTHREIQVKFDWVQMQATYYNYGKAEFWTSIQENSFDPLSILYVYRSKKRSENEQFEVPITDGKNQIRSTISIKNKKSLQIEAGKFESLKVIPLIEGIRGVFKKSKGSSIELWFSHDSNQFPLMMKSKVLVGNFKATLKSYSSNLY